MPLAGRPFLTFMLDWLGRHGVDEAILSCGFMSEAVERVLGDRHGEVALRYVVEEGLSGYMAAGYWIDIGTPERYLEATYDLLADRVQSTLPPRDETGSLVAEGCITSGARIGPMSVLGHHCSVGDRSTVERSVLHDHVRVGRDCALTGAVLAERAHLGDRVRAEAEALVGAGASVSAGSRVERGARIDPGA